MYITISFAVNPLVLVGITVLGIVTLTLGEILGAMYIAFWMPTAQRWEMLDFVEYVIGDHIGKMALVSFIVTAIVCAVVHSGGTAALWTAGITALAGFLLISFAMKLR